MRVDRVLETCLYVNDLEQAEPFYRDVLGLEFHSRQPGRHVFFRCGTSMLLLFNPDESGHANSHLPQHGAHGPGHVAFAVLASELDAWQARLEQLGVAIEKRLDWPQGGGSIYFRDPAGNSLELATAAVWGLGTDEG